MYFRAKLGIERSYDPICHLTRELPIYSLSLRGVLQPRVNVSRMSYSLWLFNHLCSLEIETSTHQSSSEVQVFLFHLVTLSNLKTFQFEVKWQFEGCPPWDFFFPVNHPLFLQWNFFFFLLTFSFGLFRKQPMLIRQTSQTGKNNGSAPTWWRWLPSWYVSSQIPFCINNFNRQQFIERDPCLKRWFCH